MGANSVILKETDKVYKEVCKCKFCGKQELINYINFGDFALPNNLFNTREEAINCNKYPLGINFCNNCGLSQLTHLVDPRILFKNYSYRSGMSNSYKLHCKELAKECKERFGLLPQNQLVVDIAGNDGTLLKEFVNIIPNLRVLNIDPASNLCKISREIGIPAVDEFFNIETALQVLISHGKANIITATNVFAHVDSQRDFLLGIKVLLHYHGALIIEFPYLIDTIEGLNYGQVYAEHNLYLTLLPIMKLCSEVGLRVFDVKKFPIHDGSLRLYITHEDSNLETTSEVEKFIENEIKKGYNDYKIYKNWENKVTDNSLQLQALIHFIKLKKKTIWGLTCSAKGNTMLNAANLTYNEIDWILDDTPEKIGKFSPNTGIEITSLELLKDTQPDYLLCLSPNFKNELIQRLKGLYKGKMIVPVPEIEIIDIE